MSVERFFVTSSIAEAGVGAAIELSEEETRHLRGAFRIGESDEVVIFDGSGHEGSAVVTHIGKRSAAVRIDAIEHAPRMPEFAPITLAVALPGGGAADDVLRRAIETGTAVIQPISTRRSVHKGTKKDPADRSERLHRLAVAVMKQCRRNVMPRFEETIELERLGLGDGVGFFGAPDAALAPLDLRERLAGPVTGITVVVGPEGGLDENEEALLVEKGFTPLRIGPTILRVETAVVALTTFFASLR